MNVYLKLTVVALFFQVSCNELERNSPLRITKTQVLDSLPSGSGIVIKDNTCFIIGDDATGVYLADLTDFKQTKIPVASLNYDLYREPKSEKRDFESATFISWKDKEYLLAFGSGSASARCNLLMMNTHEFDDHKIIPVENFYRELQTLTGTKSEAWNIEGAATIMDLLFLFNRGNNMIIQLNARELMVYLTEANATFPATTFHSIRLPMIQNHEARLSGACALDNEHLLFSASVEDTPDWIADGEVLGSFIGIYSVRDNKMAAFLLQDELGVPVKEKIESLSIFRNQPGQDLELIAVGDNDNGTTNLIHINLDREVIKKFSFTE